MLKNKHNYFIVIKMMCKQRILNLTKIYFQHLPPS